MNIVNTERKWVEETLRDSELYFRQVAELLPHLVWICAADGPCEYLSPQWVLYTGKSEAEQLDYGWLEQLHPDDRGRVAEQWRSTVAKGANFEIEFRIRRHDGACRWFRTLAVPFRDDAGHVVKWFGSNTDIDDIKQADEKLRESEQRYRSLFEHMLDGFAYCQMLFDEQGRPDDFVYLAVNDAFGRLTGLMDVIGKRATQVIPRIKELNPELFEIYGRVASTGKAERFEIDFKPLQLYLSAAVYSPAKGFFVAVFDNITERMQAAEAVRSQAALLDLAHDAIMVRDPADKVTFWSRGAEETYGWTREEALGRVTHELLRTRFPKPLAGLMAEVTGKGQWDGELIHKRKDGREIVVASRWAAQGDGAGRPAGVLEINRDVTERRRREAQVQLLLREVNHRAKNLLGVVQAIASQTASSGGEDFIARFSERIQALAANQDLLVKSQWQGVDLGNLVRAQLAHFKGLIGSRIEIAGPPLHITAEAAQPLAMALHELSTNAGKYGALSNSEGKVNIAWDVARDGNFHLSWTETAGPVVASPARRGFGTTVIVYIPQTQLDAEVALEFPPSGVTWRLSCPAKNVLEPGAAGVNVQVPA